MSEYAKKYYGVPADIGRRVRVCGELGTIYQDGGNYIAVNFDKDKPGITQNCHPTWEVEYLEMGKIRRMSKSQARYKRFLEYGDGFHSFIDYCRWDAERERSWNQG
jgi:hypothetical protein